VSLFHSLSLSLFHSLSLLSLSLSLSLLLSSPSLSPRDGKLVKHSVIWRGDYGVKWEKAATTDGER
jgi:hypothetical protein